MLTLFWYPGGSWECWRFPLSFPIL